MRPFRTLDDVVGGLSSLEAAFENEGDRRAVFLTLYGVVSHEMRDRVARKTFGDSDWVHRYAVRFANLYLEALEAYDAGRLAEVPKAWRLCFDSARAGTGLVLQAMLLGVNAHVNHDLPFALNAVSIDPDRQARYDDHKAVNEVLASVTERATARLAAFYAPGLPDMDECAGELDEMATLFSLHIARESAWESAVALANARNSVERALASTLIGSRAAVLARLLLASTLSPHVAAACSRMEQGVSWKALSQSIARGLQDDVTK
jgi:hypothetical protein